MTTNKEIIISEVKAELNKQISDIETFNMLLTTTFSGLKPDVAKRAMLEAMIRGYSFPDFLHKNIYAVPFKDGYSLVTSIDYARKIGMRSGVCGKSAPEFVEDGNKIISCTITVKRRISDYVGDYSATVYMSEYSTGKMLWASKPRTMLAKVAEMHALRMACPEELSQSYVEEEYSQPSKQIELEDNSLLIEEWSLKLDACAGLEELKNVWTSVPGSIKTNLNSLKDDLKKKYED